MDMKGFLLKILKYMKILTLEATKEIILILQAQDEYKKELGIFFKR